MSQKLYCATWGSFTKYALNTIKEKSRITKTYAQREQRWLYVLLSRSPFSHKKHSDRFETCRYENDKMITHVKKMFVFFSLSMQIYTLSLEDIKIKLYHLRLWKVWLVLVKSYPHTISYHINNTMGLTSPLLDPLFNYFPHWVNNNKTKKTIAPTQTYSHKIPLKSRFSNQIWLNPTSE
jgi:hypothetical protein